ncbi:ranBP-type and C3HC4-type zinc finger-containing protein 1 isoform X1 [Carcharodon carcharias]|uniref:ranBP-type and C3HC4-type zinc finger-containing protein 1 isoform X1 n=1 Tax=Carcharodon carcharias TaxID=13397 RepID=UPI001B7EF20B|nr:ranBP-type and C3HC4-type zinc finger-containing protein 1 isoform X1 [Carcharodon carcharias]
MAKIEARGLGPAPQQVTVLMSCRVSEGVGGGRGLTLGPGSGLGPPAAAGGEHSALRLQLSMERPGEFRLGVHYSDSLLSKSLSLYEFNLKDIIYEFKSATCHGISTRSQPTEQLTFLFEDEKEAQKWSTIITSSLREVEKASSTAGQQNQNGSTGTPLQSAPPVTEGGAGLRAEPPKVGPDISRTGMDISRTEDLIQQLAKAIEAGDSALSSECAVTLAQQKVCLGIWIKEAAYPNQQISMRVGVEDAASSATIVVKVFPYATVSTLKQQVFRDFGFHPVVQRWIIGQCLAVDHRTLSSYGVKKDGDSAFLYLLSAKLASLPRRQYEEDQALTVMAHGETGIDMQRRESLLEEEKRKYSILPSKLLVNKGRLPQKDRDGRIDINNIAQCINLELKSLQPLPSQDTWSRPLQQASLAPQSTQAGWACEKCTYINKPTRPGCEMCSSPRPPEYSVPQDYKPDDEELCRILQEREAMQRYQQELEEKRLQNYQNLLQLDGQHLVLNREPIECRICLLDVKPGEGVVLRDCLHSFCSECLKQLIRSCTEPQVPCPFRDESYACNSKLQEREVRALVSLEDYDKFLDRGMSVAESSSENSYHCKTADCRGWCIYEDMVNEFRCPICLKLNCLLCKAIHEGMNCKQYQDDLRCRAVNDSAARRTTEMLKTMVQTGEAMHCPKCKIIVQKKDGCDWLRCPVCHTEICWVTKGYRWGPGGPGDTNGGCRCLVNGQRCHPLCQNCH